MHGIFYTKSYVRGLSVVKTTVTEHKERKWKFLLCMNIYMYS